MSNLVLNFTVTEVKKVEVNGKDGLVKETTRLKLFCPEYKFEQDLGFCIRIKTGQITYYMYGEFKESAELIGKQFPIEHALCDGELIPTQFKVTKKEGTGEFEGMIFKIINPL